METRRKLHVYPGPESHLGAMYNLDHVALAVHVRCKDVDRGVGSAHESVEESQTLVCGVHEGGDEGRRVAAAEACLQHRHVATAVTIRCGHAHRRHIGRWSYTHRRTDE